jgi:hypothetical protein
MPARIRAEASARDTWHGGHEPALGTDHILRADDSSPTVALRHVLGGSALYKQHTSAIRDRIARLQQSLVVS